MGWLRLVGSSKLYVSFIEYRLFYRAQFAKETCNFKEPTNRSNRIVVELRIFVGKEFGGEGVAMRWGGEKKWIL